MLKYISRAIFRSIYRWWISLAATRRVYLKYVTRRVLPRESHMRLLSATQRPNLVRKGYPLGRYRFGKTPLRAILWLPWWRTSGAMSDSWICFVFKWTSDKCIKNLISYFWNCLKYRFSQNLIQKIWCQNKCVSSKWDNNFADSVWTSHFLLSYWP